MEPPTTCWANSFWYPKVVGRERDWEDACRFDVARGRFAIADGASTSYRAREWARLLVDGYIDEEQSGIATNRFADAGAWFERRARAWQQHLATEAAVSKATGNWWDHVATDQLAYAAFLGVSLRMSGGGVHYAALAVGDCCLLHLRGRTLISSFPLESPQEFTRTPGLAGSGPGATRPALIRQAQPRPVYPGDALVLASDALAKALLTQHQFDDAVWAAVRSVNHDGFQAMITNLRAQKAIDVDDVTMLRIVFPDDHARNGLLQ